MIPEYGRQQPLVLASPNVEREVRRRAVRAVCELAPSAVAARDVLDALGLDPREGRVPATSSVTSSL